MNSGSLQHSDEEIILTFSQHHKTNSQAQLPLLPRRGLGESQQMDQSLNRSYDLMNNSTNSQNSTDTKLSQEESYLLKDTRSSRGAYLRYFWLYLVFLLLVGGYSVVMIVEWSVTLSFFNFEAENCSNVSSTNIKFIVFHSLHIAVYCWGLFSSFKKLPKGVIFYLVLILGVIIWRVTLFYSYFNDPQDVISSCYDMQRFNTKGQNLHFILMAETFMDILGILLGIQLYRKTRMILSNKCRLNRLAANSSIYKKTKVHPSK